MFGVRGGMPPAYQHSRYQTDSLSTIVAAAPGMGSLLLLRLGEEGPINSALSHILQLQGREIDEANEISSKHQCLGHSSRKPPGSLHLQMMSPVSESW